MCLLQAAHKPSSIVLQKLYFTAFHKQLLVTTAKEMVCMDKAYVANAKYSSASTDG